MANREFTDFGRPELFGEDGDFLGSQADYNDYKCGVCGDLVPGLSIEDAAEHHALDVEDHDLQAVCDECGDDLDENESCPNGCHEV